MMPPGWQSLSGSWVQCCAVCPGSSLVSRLEEEGVDDEDGVDVLGTLAGVHQRRVVVQAQALGAVRQGQGCRSQFFVGLCGSR